MNTPALLPIIDQVISFMESALAEDSSKQAQVIQLQEEVKRLRDSQDKVVLEKVAAAKASFFDTAALNDMFIKLEGMGVIDKSAHERLVHRIQGDPNMLIPLVAKVAENLLSSPGEGSGIEHDTGNEGLEEDPDGWKAMAQGQRVALRK